jgi:hypothetical protein
MIMGRASRPRFDFGQVRVDTNGPGTPHRILAPSAIRDELTHRSASIHGECRPIRVLTPVDEPART